LGYFIGSSVFLQSVKQMEIMRIINTASIKLIDPDLFI